MPSQPHLVGEAVDLVVSIRARTIQELLRVHRYDPAARDFVFEDLAPPTIPRPRSADAAVA